MVPPLVQLVTVPVRPAAAQSPVVAVVTWVLVRPMRYGTVLFVRVDTVTVTDAVLLPVSESSGLDTVTVLG